MIKLILFILILGSFSASALDQALIHKTSFDETLERFPSPYAIIEEFRRIVPQRPNGTINGTCMEVDRDAAPVLGTIDPMRGESLEKKPGALFYQYYQDCVLQLVVNEAVSDPDGLSKNILGTHYDEVAGQAFIDCTAGKLTNMSCARPTMTVALDQLFWLQTDWSAAGPELKFELLDSFIDFLAGPDEVLAAQGYLGPKTAFGVSLVTRADLIKFLSKKLDAMAAKNSNYKMALAYANIAVILRLGPALKG